MKKPSGRKSQVSLEMAVAFFLTILIVAGILRVFIWVNARMVMLQQDYEKNRGYAGNTINSAPIPINEEAFPQLDIMGNKALYVNQSN